MGHKKLDAIEPGTQVYLGTSNKIRTTDRYICIVMAKVSISNRYKIGWVNDGDKTMITTRKELEIAKEQLTLEQLLTHSSALYRSVGVRVSGGRGASKTV